MAATVNLWHGLLALIAARCFIAVGVAAAVGCLSLAGRRRGMRAQKLDEVRSFQPACTKGWTALPCMARKGEYVPDRQIETDIHKSCASAS